MYEIRDFPETAYLIIEYFEGKELFDVISKKAMSEDKFRPLFRQLVDALDYLHHYNVCHRDIKPENILVNKVRPAIRAMFCVGFRERDSLFI